MLVYVSKKDFFGYVHVAMTLGETIGVGFGVSGNMRRLVNLIHLLEDEVVCAVVLADNGYSAAFVVEAYINLTNR